MKEPDKKLNKQELMFMRRDLDQTSTGNTAYYRLNIGMKEFIELLLRRGEIEGIVLHYNEDDESEETMSFNIGFVFKDNETNQDKQ